jgi:hypothetical protein
MNGQETSGERAGRLMKKFSTTTENGSGGSGAGASGASGAGATGGSSTGDAGISSLGAIPDGPLGIVGTTKRRKHRNKSECHYCRYNDNALDAKICSECGSGLSPIKGTKSMAERLVDYRAQQIEVDCNGRDQYDWIGSAVSQIMEVVKTKYPTILHEDDNMTYEVLNERIKNTLHGFNNWRIRHEQGLDV